MFFSWNHGNYISAVWCHQNKMIYDFFYGFRKRRKIVFEVEPRSIKQEISRLGSWTQRNVDQNKPSVGHSIITPRLNHFSRTILANKKCLNCKHHRSQIFHENFGDSSDVDRQYIQFCTIFLWTVGIQIKLNGIFLLCKLWGKCEKIEEILKATSSSMEAENIFPIVSFHTKKQTK